MKSRLRVLTLCLLLSTAPAAATITNSQNTVTIAGNGSQTSFGFGFVGVSASDISVVYTSPTGVQTTLAQGPGSTQYQVTLNTAVPGQIWGVGGTITYNPSGTPIPNSSLLTIIRTVPNQQTVNLQNQASFGQYAKSTEQMGDLLEMQLQQNSNATNRAIVANVANSAFPNPLPPASQVAGLGLCFDNTGNNVVGCAAAPAGTISSALLPFVGASTLQAAELLLPYGIITPVSVFNFLSTAQIADVQAGTCTLDVSSEINTALSTIGKGRLYFPTGVYCIGSPITINTGQYLNGDSRGPTIIRNIPSTATVLLITANYNSLVGTNTQGGPYQWGVSDILFDGNKSSISHGTADVMDIYGYDYTFYNVTIWNATAQGMFSQWAVGPNVPVPSGGDAMEAHFYNLKIYQSAGLGLNFQGPHDSMFNQTLIIENGNGGAFFQTAATYSADGTFLNNFHSYGNAGPSGLFIDANEMHGSTIESETNAGVGIEIGSGGNGSLDAADVFAFGNGTGGAADGITLNGFRSVLSGVVTRNNSQNGISLIGLENQASNVYASSNSGIGISMTGTNSVVIGGVATGNTLGNYQANSSTASVMSVVDSSGHFGFSGPTPSLTSGCNGTGSAAHGTDNAGFAGGQTASATSCVLTFAHTWNGSPACVVSGIAQPITFYSVNSATLTVNFSSQSDMFFHWQCSSLGF